MSGLIGDNWTVIGERAGSEAKVGTLPTIIIGDVPDPDKCKECVIITVPAYKLVIGPTIGGKENTVHTYIRKCIDAFEGD